METLPYELVLKIAEHLSANDIINLCESNQTDPALCNDWLHWSKLANKDLSFPIHRFRHDGDNPIHRYNQIKSLTKYPFRNPEVVFEQSLFTGDKYNTDILVHYLSLPLKINYLLRSAREGNYFLLDRILDDSRVDPSIYNNMAIIDAIKNGHANVVQRLLMDPRVDPNADGNVAFEKAIINNDIATVSVILNSDRFKSNKPFDVFVQISIDLGHVEMARILLTNDQINIKDKIKYLGSLL